jgi:CubicO group peptidase (beta-lactamase class C family)
VRESDAIAALLGRGASEGCFRGATWRVESGGSVLSEGSAGQASSGTPFDLASLTKPLATALLALLLEEEGRLDLSSPARALLPELQGTAHHDVTLHELGCHTSGLPE